MSFVAFATATGQCKFDADVASNDVAAVVRHDASRAGRDDTKEMT